jgi:predicted RNA-binding Zn-ribbon protein involved in translation (DUF1610 family)
MLVIEKAKKPTVWTADVICKGVPDVCDGCGATLRIEEDDLFRIRVGRAGFERFVAQFQCPECGARTDFYNYPVPDVLVDYAEHRQYDPQSWLAGYEGRP